MATGGAVESIGNAYLPACDSFVDDGGPTRAIRLTKG
jgi:hypothetical protein